MPLDENQGANFKVSPESIAVGGKVSTLQIGEYCSVRISRRISDLLAVRRVIDQPLSWRYMRVKILSERLASQMVGLLGLSLLLAACAQTAGSQGASQTANDEVQQALSSTGERYDDYEIVTLLPRDAIAAIDDPRFVALEEANETYSDDELILGVEFNGDARAYSVPLLSSHEIVNDTVGGVKIAVTW